MHPTKTPNPDGLLPLFYYKYWSIVGDDVVALVNHVLQGNELSRGLNHTHILLNPKNEKSNTYFLV